MLTAKFEATLAMRAGPRVPENRRLAAAAVQQLCDAETTFINEKFTPKLIAQALPVDREPTVVTASLTTAAAIAEPSGVPVARPQVIRASPRPRHDFAAGALASTDVPPLSIHTTGGLLCVKAGTLHSPSPLS